MKKIIIYETDPKKGFLEGRGRFATKHKIADLFLLRYCFVDVEYQFSINPILQQSEGGGDSSGRGDSVHGGDAASRAKGGDSS